MPGNVLYLRFKNVGAKRRIEELSKETGMPQTDVAEFLICQALGMEYGPAAGILRLKGLMGGENGLETGNPEVQG